MGASASRPEGLIVCQAQVRGCHGVRMRLDDIGVDMHAASTAGVAEAAAVMDASGRHVPLPPPCAVATATHPLLKAWVDTSLPLPDLVLLDRLGTTAHGFDGVERPAVRAQTPKMLGDGRHYETRIAMDRILATRAGDVHDAFNALAWSRHASLKWALNARQVADIAEVGPKRRTRGQCALTHFDEAGAIVWLGDDTLLAAWDAHDWQALFVGAGSCWGRGIAVTVFGHALLEHVWQGHALPVAKCLVVRADAAAIAARGDAQGQVGSWPEAERRIADAIRRGELLVDPQELRPLPLAGLPGWHEGTTAAFVGSAPCFRPLRVGRRYPPAWSPRI